MAIKPTKPTVPPAPSRSSPGTTFATVADTFVAFFATLATYMANSNDFVDARADEALAAALVAGLPALTGHAGHMARVNAAGTALEFRTPAQVIADLDADLAAIAALASAADKLPYATGVGTWALSDLTAAGRVLIAAVNTAAQLSTLGISTFIQTLLPAATPLSARTTLGAHPLAQSASGVGQLTPISVTSGGTLTLPAGGTWAYYWQGENTTSGVSQFQGAGVAAGGSAIAGPAAGIQFLGWAWRIA